MCVLYNLKPLQMFDRNLQSSTVFLQEMMDQMNQHYCHKWVYPYDRCCFPVATDNK